MNSSTAIGMFVVGAILAVWATERLLEGMMGLAGAVRLSTFAVGAVLSGFEAENVAVGVAAATSNAPVIALGTVFGGAIFWCALPWAWEPYCTRSTSASRTACLRQWQPRHWWLEWP